MAVASLRERSGGSYTISPGSPGASDGVAIVLIVFISFYLHFAFHAYPMYFLIALYLLGGVVSCILSIVRI